MPNMPEFGPDPFPGRPRILFLGAAESTHTHSWVDLLDGARMNVRVFGVCNAVPPGDWRVRTYIPGNVREPLDPEWRLAFPQPRHDVISRAGRLGRRLSRRRETPSPLPAEEQWFAQVVRAWRPHIIHTLGLDPCGFTYDRLRRSGEVDRSARWVAQLRGGSDLALSRLDPVQAERIGETLRACDRLLTDNRANIEYVRAMGVKDSQIPPFVPVPGTGGLDVDRLSRLRHGRPSASRLILWPKAYENPWAKVLPVYEALKLAWPRLGRCEIRMLGADDEARAWHWTLPEEIRRACRMDARLPREQTLQLMSQARVMLAPSLVDGVPNCMLEAMATGALPLVSPLDTITSVVEPERNVLFARNLYPQEIAEALVRAMSDGALVDAAAQRNLARVRELADRAAIRPRVLEFYEELSKENQRA